MYTGNSSSTASTNQPLPGQPPLPPMPPPPPGSLPPLPHVYSPTVAAGAAAQVASVQVWPHPPPQWQWVASQQAISLQAQRDTTNNAFLRDLANSQHEIIPYRDMSARNNFARRERYNNGRNHTYGQQPRAFYRNRPNKRGQPSTAYYGQTSWQRTANTTAQNGTFMNPMASALPGSQGTSGLPVNKALEDDNRELNLKNDNVSSNFTPQSRLFCI